MQQNLPNRENCTGCAACYNSCAHGAITMQEDKEGFLIPVVNESKCIDCNLCTKSVLLLTYHNLRRRIKRYMQHII